MDELIKGTDPSVFNQAMMDLGAGICTPRKPDCDHCPVRDFCEASAAGTEALLPVNIKTHPKQMCITLQQFSKKKTGIFLSKTKKVFWKIFMALSSMR